MAWEVEYTDEFEAWWRTLDSDAQDQIDATIDVLQIRGPGLGRPLVDTIRTSRHSSMKELRPASGSIRILFAFDPRRMAILLIGGDKANRWNAWYVDAVPIADRLYDEHLDTLRKEGLI